MENKDNDQSKLPEPSLDEILDENPPVEEDVDLDYEDDEEEEDMDTSFNLEPWEENYYDDEGNFYPDGYKDDEGNLIPGARKAGK